MAHLAQVILQVQVFGARRKAQEEIQEGLVLMNHCQVQCPEDKDREQRTEVKYPWGTWLAQSVQRTILRFGSDHDLRVVEIELHVGFHTQCGVCLRFSLPLLHPLPFMLSLFLSLSNK